MTWSRTEETRSSIGIWVPMVPMATPQRRGESGQKHVLPYARAPPQRRGRTSEMRTTRNLTMAHLCMGRAHPTLPEPCTRIVRGQLTFTL